MNATTTSEATRSVASEPSEAPVRSSDWFCGITTEAIGKLANDEAMRWDTLWPNHDPSFLNACRSAFADGFMRGFRVRDEMPPNAPGERPGAVADDERKTL